MHIRIFIYCCIYCCLISCKKDKKTETIPSTATVQDTLAVSEAIYITPIQHASAVLTYENITLYIDPAGGANRFVNQPEATIVLITDIHGDHMDIDTLEELSINNAKIIAPIAVAEKLPARYTSQLIVLKNGERTTTHGIQIEAVPMYNLREEALKFHPKGRGNGYIITLGEERVYFSGDTEDIPEMRALENIDKAFICMNLPYTMTVASAADAVMAFAPKQVYPYHYRGTNGLSDVTSFREMITSRTNAIQVIQLDWYPAKETD